MPIYCADWFGSEKIGFMTAEQERGFLHLLMHAWMSGSCSLPDDETYLAKKSLMNEKWSGPDGDLVRRCFTKKRIGGEQRLVNEKLLKVWKDRRSHAERGREGGLKSGQSRRSAAKQTRSKTASNDQAKTNITFASSFASAFASSERSKIDAALARVRKETIRDTRAFLAWYRESCAAGAFADSDNLRDSLYALGLRCAAKGKKNHGCALFTTLVREGKFGHASNDEFESAVAAVGEHLNGASGPIDSEIASLLSKFGAMPEGGAA